MKSIALLAPYLRRADSIGLQLIEWVRALQKHGYDLRLFVEHISPDAPPDIVAVTHVLSGDSLPGSGHWSFLASADVVICDYPAFYNLADCLRLLSGPRIVFSYHGVTPAELWPDLEGRTYLERSRRRASLVHFADAAIVRSQFTRQELHELTGYPLERIRVVPCLVPEPDRPCRLQHAPAVPLILSIGRLAANKRPWMLVEALALVRQALPGARLVLVGDARGPSHAPVLAQVRRQADALRLSDAVHCVGLVDDGLLEHLYAQADAYAIASLHEGFCIPVVEAMARGVPVVATAGGALPETVGDAGLLVAVDDVSALAAALIDLLSNSERREQMVARGYEQAKRYRPEVITPNLLQAIEPASGARATVAPLPRLSQLVDLHAVHQAAEVGPALAAPRHVPLISPVAARLRRWLTSDLRRQLDLMNRQQVAYNRQIAEVVDALDELSATISEQQAAARRRKDR